jgi:hypothetical protein
MGQSELVEKREDALTSQLQKTKPQERECFCSCIHLNMPAPESANNLASIGNEIRWCRFQRSVAP